MIKTNANCIDLLQNWTNKTGLYKRQTMPYISLPSIHAQQTIEQEIWRHMSLIKERSLVRYCANSNVCSDETTVLLGISIMMMICQVLGR